MKTQVTELTHNLENAIDKAWHVREQIETAQDADKINNKDLYDMIADEANELLINSINDLATELYYIYDYKNLKFYQKAVNLVLDALWDQKWFRWEADFGRGMIDPYGADFCYDYNMSYDNGNFCRVIEECFSNQIY